MPLAEKAQPCRENPGKGTRQISSVCLLEGVPGLEKVQVAVTRGERLFTKNTDRREVEILSTAVDACSLPVPESPFQGEEGLVKSGGNSDPLKVA